MPYISVEKISPKTFINSHFFSTNEFTGSLRSCYATADAEHDELDAKLVNVTRDKPCSINGLCESRTSNETIYKSSSSPQSLNRTPTDLPDILCNSPVSVNACNSDSYINVPTCNGDNNYITSMQYALPLGSMVSDQIKKKIWANDFVELGSCYLNLSQNQDPNLYWLII